MVYVMERLKHFTVYRVSKKAEDYITYIDFCEMGLCSSDLTDWFKKCAS
ncbi:hypothetical protein VIBNISOn1_730036 [Vibrio nigripulchritudo SOn1]|uniref:Transposase n=1 Tax=Vibrio nigripulchritudo SOn1 TaxID=1238450 RepID=A0AAV2VWH1_9VIBR|nr:hypothetical protein VIBNISOn1_730036 [Vibrio nigripulchritudo SOn1]